MIHDQQQRAADVRNSVYGIFFRHWNVLVLVILGIIGAGLFSLSAMPLESAPELTIPIGTVTTTYPGASPADMEKLVTDRLEERLKSLQNVTDLTSVSAEGVSSIIVEFETSADIQESIQKLKDEVDRAQSDLPEDANDPVVQEVRANDESIITISLLGNVPKEDMKTYADELQHELEGLKGVSRVEISGLERREMQVLINVQALEGYGLSVMDVTSAISGEHIDLPVGSVRTDGFTYRASWRGQFDKPEGLRKLVVATKGGQNVYLEDVADVREVFAEPSSRTAIFRTEENRSTQSVTLQVYKQQGADLVRIADNVKNQASLYAEETLPRHVELLITNDLSEYIRDDLRRLITNAVQTVILIGIILFIAVGRKEATIAALSMPILYLLGITGLNLFGETFNFLVFFALIISLGVVVDNAIVIVEGIYDLMKNHDVPAEEAALISVGTYRSSLISGTLTTIAAFLPLAMMSGIIGQYVSHIPITINFTLIASLISALFIVPPVAAKYLARKSKKQEKPERAPFLEKYINVLRERYVVMIEPILQSRKLRWIWVGSMIGLFFIAMSLPAIGLLKVQMFPGSDEDVFFVGIETPPGSSLESTAAVAVQVEDAVRALPELEYYITVIGGGPVGGISGGGTVSSGNPGSNVANITVSLLEKDTRTHTSAEIAAMLREKIRGIHDGKITITETQNGPPTGAPVEVRVTGEDLPTIETAARMIQSELEQIEGTKDIDNDIEVSTGDFRFTPRRDRLTYFGVSSQQIAVILRSAVFGNDSVKIIRSGEETPIVVRLDFREEDCLDNTITQLREIRDGETICSLDPRSITDLTNLLIPTARGNVALGELVDVSLQPSVTAIRHQDGEKVVRVRSYTNDGVVAGDIVASLQQRLESIELPKGTAVHFGGENEDIAESFGSLYRAVFVAVILIFAILVWQFDSFRQVFIIMFTIPLALIGVFFGLTILGKNLSFPGMIGFAALAGIVVNDAIVLIDRINENRRRGMNVHDAIVDGGRERLQPIIITTLTTALGMMPLIFGGDVFSDLATTVSIGITFATVLTLVMVPIFYTMLTKDTSSASDDHAPKPVPSSATPAT